MKTFADYLLSLLCIVAQQVERTRALAIGVLALTAVNTMGLQAEDHGLVEWVQIPAGQFLMGGQVLAEKVAQDFEPYGRGPDYFQDEYPQHVVRITKPFLCGRTEISVGQFRRFVDETGYRTLAETDGEGGWGYDTAIRKCVGRDVRFSWRNPGYVQSDQHPVVNVTWDDCQAYCRWLSKKLQRTVRLPTEAEWEYACRGRSHSYFHTGDSPVSLTQQARVLEPNDAIIGQHVQDLEIAENSSNSFPMAVGSFEPNGYGLHDMHGNVWEWTADWHSDEYYGHSPMDDPPGPIQGNVKVRRGGGWNSFPLWARASFRNWNSPESRCVNLGFRVVGELTSYELAESQQASPIRLLFVGDIMLDGGPGHAVASGIDPFERCASLLNDADLTIGNLECVLGSEGQQLLKAYTFRAADQSPKFLKRYFDVVSLANNHSGDFGPLGLLESMKILRDHNIGYFGAGPDIRSARRGLMFELRGKKVLLLGYNGFNAQEYQATQNDAGSAPLVHEQIIQDIREGKQLRGADFIIPFVHWGSEMVSMPRESQRQMAREWIDAGACAVLGAHPHVVQTVDLYRNAPIVYSLGNFVFDYFPVDPPQWTGWTVHLNLLPHGEVELSTSVVELDSAGIPSPVQED